MVPVVSDANEKCFRIKQYLFILLFLRIFLLKGSTFPFLKEVDLPEAPQVMLKEKIIPAGIGMENVNQFTLA